MAKVLNSFCQHHCGHHLCGCFSLVDTSHKLAHGGDTTQMDAATLLPLVQQFTKPNTKDEWRAYRNVGTLPNVPRHQTVEPGVN